LFTPKFVAHWYCFIMFKSMSFVVGSVALATAAPSPALTSAVDNRRSRRRFFWKPKPKPPCEADVFWKAKEEGECRKEKCNNPMWLDEGICIDIDFDKGCGCFPNIIDKEAYKSGEMNEAPGLIDRSGDPGAGEEEVLGFRPEIDSEKSFYAVQVKSTNQQNAFFAKLPTNYVDFHTTDDKARGFPDEKAAQKSCKSSNMGYIGTIFDHAKIPAVFSGTPNFLVDVIAATGNRKKTGDASDYRMIIDDRQTGRWQSTKVQAQVNRLFEDRERGCCRVGGDGVAWRKPSTTETTEKCADEGGWCDCDGGMVSYGADGAWTTPVEAWGPVACTNTEFGDPIFGTVKSCTCTKPPEVLEVSLDKPMKEKECALRCAGYMYEQEGNRRCVGIETSKKNGGTCELHFTPIVYAENDQRTTCAKANCYTRTDYEFEFLKMRNKCPKYYDYSHGRNQKKTYY